MWYTHIKIWQRILFTNIRFLFYFQKKQKKHANSCKFWIIFIKKHVKYSSNEIFIFEFVKFSNKTFHFYISYNFLLITNK